MSGLLLLVHERQACGSAGPLRWRCWSGRGGRCVGAREVEDHAMLLATGGLVVEGGSKVPLGIGSGSGGRRRRANKARKGPSSTTLPKNASTSANWSKRWPANIDHGLKCDRLVSGMKPNWLAGWEYTAESSVAAAFSPNSALLSTVTSNVVVVNIGKPLHHLIISQENKTANFMRLVVFHSPA